MPAAGPGFDVFQFPVGQGMLQLDDPHRPADRDLLASPGGFAWWYVDALDEQGNGIVCIWSWGLPFLPGDRAAHNPDKPAPDVTRCQGFGVRRPLV